jgi:hypothetical protein
MSHSNTSSQTLSAPASPALLAATPTWDPRINPDPAWIHFDGMPGMEHLVNAAEGRGRAAGGLAGTPPGSPRPDTGPAPRQETWSVAYGNPPPWMATVPLTRANALRISTHQEFTAEQLDGEGTPPGWPSIPAPRVGAARPHFMEPLTTGSSAVSSPVDRGDGWNGGGDSHVDGFMPLPSPPAEPFVPQELTVLPPSTPVPNSQT